MSTPALNFGSILIGTDQPEALAEFYQKVVGRVPDMSEGGFTGWKVGTGYIVIGGHSEIHGQAKEPARIMFNFDTTEVQSEFDRLKSLGATVIREPYQFGEEMLATLADPDGNYFQLIHLAETG